VVVSGPVDGLGILCCLGNNRRIAASLLTGARVKQTRRKRSKENRNFLIDARAGNGGRWGRRGRRLKVWGKIIWLEEVCLCVDGRLWAIAVDSQPGDEGACLPCATPSFYRWRGSAERNYPCNPPQCSHNEGKKGRKELANEQTNEQTNERKNYHQNEIGILEVGERDGRWGSLWNLKVIP